MYSCHIKKYTLFWIIISLGLCGCTFWFDLVGEIQNKFQPDYDLWISDKDLPSDKYLELPYDSSYSKDPFWDAMNVYTWMSAQTRVASVKYLEKALSLQGCSLSKEKQWAILYYFVPEFRWEIARGLKIDYGDYDSKNYVFDEDVILDYCTEFYNCVTNTSVWTEWKKVITSGTPEDIKTNCKEFFQVNYREWQAEEKKIQNLQISWLWNDKYVNATYEDSPYDLMIDLGTIWELSYLKAQKPITPLFYDLPVFAKSKEALLNGKNWWNGECVEETYGGVASLGGDGVSLWGLVGWEKWGAIWLNVPGESWKTSWEWEVSWEWKSWWDWNGNAGISPRSTRVSPSEYDSLVEWLWALKLNEDKSTYYWSLCREKEEEQEPEQEVEAEEKKEEAPIVRGATVVADDGVPQLTKAEYEELVNYMQESVNSYASLSESKKKEIEAKAKNTPKSVTSVEEIESAAESILDCYKSCVWLSIDEQFACMLQCSCGEIESPIFDPDVNPGMWPIFIVRFCAVPAVNPRYFTDWSIWTESWNSTMKSSGRSWGWSKNWWGTIWWSKSWWSSWWWSKGWWSNGWWSNGWWNSWWGTIWWSKSWWSSCYNWWEDESSNEAIAPSYNKGWTKMVSMEKWINEIHWVVDKLAREWRLWTWTQQYNFLDSTTKNLDVHDTFSFTMGMDKKSIAQKPWEPTEEYQKRYMKTRNDNWMVAHHVSNPLDNPSTKNYYRLVSYQWEVVGDISSSANADATRQSQWYLDVAPSFVVDQSENSNASRYAMISELFSNWMDEQWDFWTKKLEYIKELDQYAKALYAKKW